MKPRVVIYGAGQMAGLFAYRHSREGFHWELDLAGFVDDHATGEIAGFPILGKSEDLERLKEERGIDSVIMFAVKDPIWRLEKCLELAEKGSNFPSLVDCYVAPEVKIGQGVIIDEKACFLGYSAKIEDFAMIGPYAVVEGDSHLGRGV
jgi:FlaA1/EpsC-like NDP-sugar epimerase